MANSYYGIWKRINQFNVSCCIKIYLLLWLPQVLVGFSIKDNDNKLVKTSSGVVHPANVKSVKSDSRTAEDREKPFDSRQRNPKGLYRTDIEDSSDSVSDIPGVKRAWDSDSAKIWGKRGWDTDSTRVWGKRAWDTDSARVWGKRGWDSDSARVWGKRGWDSDSARVWGKRGWDTDAARVWGKRAWDSDSARVWGKRTWDTDSTRIWGKRSDALPISQAKEVLRKASGEEKDNVDNLTKLSQTLNNFMLLSEQKFGDAVQESLESPNHSDDATEAKTENYKAEVASGSQSSIGTIPDIMKYQHRIQNLNSQGKPSNVQSSESIDHQNQRSADAVRGFEASEKVPYYHAKDQVNSRTNVNSMPSSIITLAKTPYNENLDRTDISLLDTTSLSSKNANQNVGLAKTPGTKENLQDPSISDVHLKSHKVVKRSLLTDGALTVNDLRELRSLKNSKRVWDTDSIRVWGKRSEESPDYTDKEEQQPREPLDSDSLRIFDKRAWDTDSTRVWGKRAWDTDSARVWGKRAWDTDSARVWGKRAWDTDSARVWGKRAWDTDSTRVWGKRAWDTDAARVWGKRSWDADSARVWGKRAWDTDSARVWGKRAWSYDPTEMQSLVARNYWNTPDAHSLISQNADQTLDKKYASWNDLSLSPKFHWKSDSAVDWNQYNSL